MTTNLYPRWWFDWNLELQRFSNRVTAYLALLDDRYPSTTETQSVHLDYDYPDAANDLNRWPPVVTAVVFAWFAILLDGRHLRSLFDFVTGVFRWDTRVLGYAFTLVTDEYPPFRLS